MSSCSAGPRYSSLAAGPAIIINIICLYHSAGTSAFSRRYEDDMLINEYSRHSAIRPAPHPPSPASHPPPRIPKRDGTPICFPAGSPTPLLFALKGTNSIHSYDKDSLIQERKKEREYKKQGWVKKEFCPGGNKQQTDKKGKKKVAELEVSRKKQKKVRVEGGSRKMDKPFVFSRCGLMWWADIVVSADVVIWRSGALQMKQSVFKPTSQGSLKEGVFNPENKYDTRRCLG